MKKVITLGCRLNFQESEIIKDQINNISEDVIVVHSCAVTNEAERQVRQSIRREKRNNPSAKIFVVGCAAQLHPNEYSDMPEVYKVLGNQEKLNRKYYVSDRRIEVGDIDKINKNRGSILTSFSEKSRAFVQIQNGCNHACTFCSITTARGNNRSVPLNDVISQVREFLNIGYNEVIFTGVDISDYGKDLPGSPTLGQLCRRVLNSVPELHRLRLSSIDVAEIDNELIDIIKHEKRFMPHLHLSLQAGDNMILKRMKRRHTREQVIDFCDDIISTRSEVVFGADVIAGFPTETEEMFKKTCDLLSGINFVHLHVFPYSPRKGTIAARMPQLQNKIKSDRAKKMRKIGEKHMIQHYKSSIGKKMNVVIENEIMSRAEDFSVVKSHFDPRNRGKIARVNIIASEDKCVIGELIA